MQGKELNFDDLCEALPTWSSLLFFEIFVCSGTFLCNLMLDITNLSAAFFYFFIKIICVTEKLTSLQFSDMQISMHMCNLCRYIWTMKLVFTNI